MRFIMASARGENKMRKVVIHSDGACHGNPGPGGWAVVLTCGPHKKELSDAVPATTNNRMEMLGAMAALSFVRDRPEPVKIFTDSALLINGITKWIRGWRRNGWMTAAGHPVVNRDLWERLELLTQARKRRLSWGHVKGHAGHEINERCDVIAVAFSKGARPALYDGPAVGCGYSLMEPGPEHLRGSAPSGGSSSHRKKTKGGYYLSLVAGSLERHITWPECQGRVNGVSGARFKKVASAEEEEAVLKLWGV